MINNISVWWHVIGVAVIIVILVFVPDQHQSFSFVFGERINNSGFKDGANSGFFFWFYVLPLGFLLTQYTITGFDASAHISEETHGASTAAAQGRLAVDLLLGGDRLDPAAGDHLRRDNVGAINNGLTGTAPASLEALGYRAPRQVRADHLDDRAAVLRRRLPDQRLAHVLRVLARPRLRQAGSKYLVAGQLRAASPFNAVIGMAIAALIVTIPALKGAPGTIFPFAFFAVVSITVIGLYIAYVIPIYLRWRMGDAFEPPAWNIGRKYKWMNPVATIWVAIICIVVCLPFTSRHGVPWDETASPGTAFNYAPIVRRCRRIFGAWIGWMVSAATLHRPGAQHRRIGQHGVRPPTSAGPRHHGARNVPRA